MSDTTITITSATNPTYGGRVNFDGAVYSRQELDAADPTASFDGGTTVNRAFAFFDLSVDPTSGGTITKVELLATVNSVSGTHATRVMGALNTSTFLGNPPTGASDSDTYVNISDFGDVLITDTFSVGAIAVDLGVDAVSKATNAIATNDWLDLLIKLDDEGAAGSVVFDAAVGFGLRITYTPAASGPANLKTWGGIAAASIKTINGVAIENVATVNGI